MLLLKPNCELCDRDLAPNSLKAMICSYECTFCQTCVETILENVCPNCGGGLSPRPIRPKTARRKGVSLDHHPASKTRIKSPYNKAEIRKFIATVSNISTEQR